jgi:hypothetical protein
MLVDENTCLPTSTVDTSYASLELLAGAWIGQSDSLDIFNVCTSLSAATQAVRTLKPDREAVYKHQAAVIAKRLSSVWFNTITYVSATRKSIAPVYQSYYRV